MALLRIVTVTLCMCCIGFSQVCLGEAIYDKQGDVIPAGAEIMQGVLVKVNSEQGKATSVIIGDSSYLVDANTICKKASGRLIGLTGLKAGTQLEFYVLDGLVTKIMVALDQTDSNQVEDVTNDSPSTGESNPVRLENGVWKN